MNIRNIVLKDNMETYVQANAVAQDLEDNE